MRANARDHGNWEGSTQSETTILLTAVNDRMSSLGDEIEPELKNVGPTPSAVPPEAPLSYNTYQDIDSDELEQLEDEAVSPCGRPTSFDVATDVELNCTDSISGKRERVRD